jgi:hypothetical protein
MFVAPIPALMHVNQRARSVALAEYENHPHSTDWNPAYVNFGRDTFCPIITSRSFLTGEWKTFLRTVPSFGKIQRLALPKRCFEYPSSALIQALLQYTNLKEVVVLDNSCTAHRPQENIQKYVGWSLGPGVRLPRLENFGAFITETFDAFEEKEPLEDYSIAFMDKIRQERLSRFRRDLEFVYKGICWGGECWEMEDHDHPTEENPNIKGTKGRVAAKRLLRRGIAKLLMVSM